jgi:hypothetical protein
VRTQTPSPAKSPRLSPPRLRLARFDDYPQIARLESSHSLDTQPEHDWRGVWLENPLWPRLNQNWPIGWVLEDAGGHVVGSVMNVPSMYRFRGRELISANGRAWVVSGEYRGFSLLLMDEYFNQSGADLFINTTVGPMATGTLNELATRVPLGDWRTIAYWITGYRGFAHKALGKMGVPLAGLLAHPAAGALWAKDALFRKSLPAAAGSVVIAETDRFDSRFDSFWDELLRQNPEKLLAWRDSQALSWHFAIPMRRGRLWIFTASRDGLLRAYCILKRQDREEGMRRMRLVDYQSVEPDCDLLPDLLRAALRRCAAEKIDILDHLGCDLPKMRSFDRFAPYRQKNPYWPFYYQAADPALADDLRQPQVWDPSSFDGDASFE